MVVINVHSENVIHANVCSVILINVVDASTSIYYNKLNENNLWKYLHSVGAVPSTSGKFSFPKHCMGTVCL